MIARDPAERARIVRELGVSKVTLGRWMRNEHTPLPRTIAQLLDTLTPGQREEMLRLLLLDNNLSTYSFAAGHKPQQREQEAPLELSSAFYDEALRLPDDTPDLFWQMCGLVMDKLLAMLDPPCPWRSGVELLVARCALPRDGIVCSLREEVGMGTDPWRQDQHRKEMFLGEESLAGYVVTTGRYHVINDIAGQGGGALLPFLPVPHERSEAAFPILLQGRVAGALVVASTQVGFFTAARLALIQRLTRLLRSAFATDEFYPLARIQLRTMPPWDVQQTYLATIPKLHAQLLLEVQREELHPGLPANKLLLQVERRVTAALEEQFLTWQDTRAEVSLALREA